MTGCYGRSAVSISTFANGALGEHLRQDRDGMRLEIAPPWCRSSVQQINKGVLSAAWAGERQPRQSGSNCGADRWIEPQRSAAGLPRVPNGNDLLGLSDGLAFSLIPLRLGSSLGGGSLAILWAVRSHSRIVDHFGAGTNCTGDPFG
jgi:hypothetical protein